MGPPTGPGATWHIDEDERLQAQRMAELEHARFVRGVWSVLALPLAVVCIAIAIIAATLVYGTRDRYTGADARADLAAMNSTRTQMHSEMRADMREMRAQMRRMESDIDRWRQRLRALEGDAALPPREPLIAPPKGR